MAFWPWAKRVVSWQVGRVLYLSIPFTWLVPSAERMAAAHDGRVIAGGPGMRLLHPDGCDWAETPEAVPYDVLAMHNPLATFTSRGCPRRCAFCAVPKLEGEFRELRSWRPAPIVCDNNLLASSRVHFRRVIESLQRFPAVDFNQGLDARLFTQWHASELSSLNAIIRFSFDSAAAEYNVAKAIAQAQLEGIPKRNIRVYVLVGFKDTPEEARARLETVRAWGIKPNPQRFHPLDARQPRAYVGPGWTRELLRDVCRYYSHEYLRAIPFGEFHAASRARQRRLCLEAS